ncbi:immune inhibitor A [Shewanella sp. 202IG2-18]|uniref:immune inhibitor A domain-containing protein n=1 Tax=Parashewanella hymeniacidonis TaxID=2807618 RepID=UPI001960FA7D|nr:immune inhibitor A domain-containing protein [Parashewanella hymeniacidonis]MBM7071987.1 immune inhibitor A [Parashewanella hymeniacidonis]
MEKLQKTKLAIVCGAGLLALGFNVVAKPIKQNLADAGVVNQERILYWLEKRGVISKDASEVEKQAALEAYLSKTSSQSKDSYPALALKAEQKRLNAPKKQPLFARSLSFTEAAPKQTTVKVLGVLVDFPDLPHNNNRLSSSDTAMYYDNYTAEHYRGLLFAETGFVGPSGQNLLSAHQYFQQASGETFNFTGDVKGWYTASQNAAYYGENDPDRNDNDKAVGELVKEAVTAAVADMSTDELQSYDIEDPYDIDGDGNLNESDGIIDHIMLFHSSVGEEAGGGVIGGDAIWSHRFFVDSSTNGYSIPGTSMKAFGYTVQPIDAAAGVCAHEFGHDLGLPDEYDTASSKGKGSPVGSWSIMSGGSWAGVIPGAKPTGFSPYARSYLQNKFGGNWVKEQVILLDSVANTPRDVQINSATNSDAINQISLPLPPQAISFKEPYAGDYQYYSGEGHLINNAMSFDVDLPSESNLLLKMKAHWNIETDFDFVQIKVDGVSVSGNHTKATNITNNARNIITGDSADIPSSEGENNWVNLEFDLSAYAGRNVTISISYATDQAVGEYGFVADEVLVTAEGETVLSNNAEELGNVNLSGFVRTGDTKPGKASRYIVQLRNHQGLDAGLQSESYVPGVLIWLENFNESDNNVSDHAGRSLIGVVDADQNLISDLKSPSQVRDATFSLYDQSSYLGGLDSHLLHNSKFDDSQDYSAPTQSESGMVLRSLGISIEVVDQAQDSSSATIRINRSTSSTPEVREIQASFSSEIEFNVVNFTSNANGGSGEYQFEWNFGDGSTSTEISPTHSYQTAGNYGVTLTITDSENRTESVSENVEVYLPITAAFSQSVNNLAVIFTNNSAGGKGEVRYEWGFGDGNISTQQSPNHTYNRAGTYQVTLLVTDEENSTKSVSKSVTVNVTDTTVSPDNNSGSSGGTFSFYSLMLLLGLRMKRKSR